MLAKNQYTQRKPLYFENTGSASLSKIGHNFRKNVVKKLKLETKMCSTKKGSPELIFLIDFFFEKTPSVFDIENLF